MITCNYTIWCDNKNCNELEILDHTVKKTRLTAKKKGWIRKKTLEGFIDLCPKCINYVPFNSQTKTEE